MKVYYKPSFVRALNKLPRDLQEEVIEKIELFKVAKNHKHLKVHKLKGKLKDRYSFSVNYKYRIVFLYISKAEAVLLAVGDHDVYKQ